VFITVLFQRHISNSRLFRTLVNFKTGTSRLFERYRSITPKRR
jgi:hypothetical protein